MLKNHAMDTYLGDEHLTAFLTMERDGDEWSALSSSQLYPWYACSRSSVGLRATLHVILTVFNTSKTAGSFKQLGNKFQQYK
jgi:hypothetical protein